MNGPADFPPLMNRRAALGRMALLMGGTIVGAQYFLNGTRVLGKEAAPGFSAADIALLDEIGETIIPATGTPGAKATQIVAFMVMMVNDCYDAAHHAIFQAGLAAVDEACRKQTGKAFLAASAAERTALLNQLDAAARPPQNPPGPPHYFRLMKQLTLLGYFSSEIGCTQALRYQEVPGSFNGNVPYKKGDRAWFTPSSHNL